MSEPRLNDLKTQANSIWRVGAERLVPRGSRRSNTSHMGRKKTLTQTQRVQVYQKAWATLRDWITAQFALIDTGMAQAEDVFLPYLLVDAGQTLYEALQGQQFLLPSADPSAAGRCVSRRVITPETPD